MYKGKRLHESLGKEIINASSSMVTDISGKQDILVSATNIKTINSNSILGSGDLVVSGMRGNALFVMATDPNLTEDVEINDAWLKIPII